MAKINKLNEKKNISSSNNNISEDNLNFSDASFDVSSINKESNSQNTRQNASQSLNNFFLSENESEYTNSYFDDFQKKKRNLDNEKNKINTDLIKIKKEPKENEDNAKSPYSHENKNSNKKGMSIVEEINEKIYTNKDLQVNGNLEDNKKLKNANRNEEQDNFSENEKPTYELDSNSSNDYSSELNRRENDLMKNAKKKSKIVIEKKSGTDENQIMQNQINSSKDSSFIPPNDNIENYNNNHNYNIMESAELNFSNSQIDINNIIGKLSESKENDPGEAYDMLNNSLVSNKFYRETEMSFIKYLIVCNFKSYENENVLGPFSKFTSIIGPNGSGKSNIMDCISFVLGLNNKYLRIKNLKDLIYRKENEKPDSIHKRKCYVKLILECKKKNVELKRTLNSKGVTNFYIDDKLVDLKEYRNFLRKSRIETKTKTCLIFQGDIEDIINKKPTELAKLFEYISGSCDYEMVYEDLKEKLKEKQILCKSYLSEKKKLEQDIRIHKMQINDNIEHNQLKEDYEKSIKMFYLFRIHHYIKKKEKFMDDLLSYKEAKMDFEQTVLTKNKKTANDLEKKKLDKKREHLKMEDEIKNENKKLNNVKMELNEVNEKIEFFENALNKIAADEKIKNNVEKHCASFLDNLNAQMKEQSKKLEQEYKKKMKIFSKLLNKYKGLKEYIQSNNSEIWEILKEEKQIDKLIANSDFEDESNFNKCNILKIIEEMKEYKEYKKEYLYLCANNNININNYTSIADTLRRDLKELQEECDNYNRKKKKEMLDLESEKISLDELTERAIKLEKMIAEGEKNVEDSKIKLKQFQITINEKEKRIEQLDDEINMLNVHKNEIVYFEKRKEIIRSLKNVFVDEVYDELSNLYEIPNNAYYEAVSNLFNKFNNFIVVKHVDTCLKCIKYLKDNKLGKMDFIPLDNFMKNIQKEKEKWRKTRLMKKTRQKNKRMRHSLSANLNSHMYDEEYTIDLFQYKDKEEDENEDGEEERPRKDIWTLINQSKHIIDPEKQEEEDEKELQQETNDMLENITSVFTKKNIKLARECVICDSQFKPLIDYYVGRHTLIVDSVDDADDIKTRFPQYEINIVTLKGHVYTKNNNFVVDISSKFADKEKHRNKKGNANQYNKLVNEKETCKKIINECNKNIIETSEAINKKTSELELNKKKVASIYIKKDIFEKEIEAKKIVIKNYEENIAKLQNEEIKNKKDTLEKYENNLLKERKGLSSFQKDVFEKLNKKLKTDNVFEVVEHNTKEVETIEDNIRKIKNNIKKIKDDIVELQDKKKQMCQRQNVGEEQQDKEENLKCQLNELKEKKQNIIENIEKITTKIKELEKEKLKFVKELGQLNQELHNLREGINCDFEKYEIIVNELEEAEKKIEIYKNFIKDLLNECDINSVNIFVSSNYLKDGSADDIFLKTEKNKKNKNNNNNKKNKNKPNTRSNRKSKLMESGTDSHNESSNSESNDNSNSGNSNDEKENEEFDDYLLSNIDFDILPNTLKSIEDEEDINKQKERMEKEIQHKKTLLKLKNINCNAEKEHDKLQTELKKVDELLAEERKQCSVFEKNFRILQKKRSFRFLHCFNYIRNVIDNVYNNLTYNAQHKVGGQAFLDLYNVKEYNKDDEPFYCGVKYNNMPPMKRYFEISELSGGEKSISALALIFSIQKYINNSFIILDEVDANMDHLKIYSLARYLNSLNSQVIVISLKDKFFSKSQTLIGVYKNKQNNCSKTITLDLTKYHKQENN